MDERGYGLECQAPKENEQEIGFGLRRGSSSKRPRMPSTGPVTRCSLPITSRPSPNARTGASTIGPQLLLSSSDNDSQPATSVDPNSPFDLPQGVNHVGHQQPGSEGDSTEADYPQRCRSSSMSSRVCGSDHGSSRIGFDFETGTYNTTVGSILAIINSHCSVYHVPPVSSCFMPGGQTSGPRFPGSSLALAKFQGSEYFDIPRNASTNDTMWWRARLD